MMLAKPVLLALAALASSAGAAPSPVAAQMAASALATAPFELAPLPYAADALDHVIDARTMSIHHGKHHQAYVNNLNKADAANPALAGVELDQLVARAGTLSAAVRNNAGGHWNHTFFWETMAPVGEGGDCCAIWLFR